MVEEGSRSSIPHLGQSVSAVETRQRKPQVGAANLPSLMNIDNVQYTTLKKLRNRNKDDEDDEVAYGSPAANTSRGKGIKYSIKTTYLFEHIIK
jgi:hypothetical protein